MKIIESNEYYRCFWDSMKGTDGFVGDMDGARNLDTGTYSLPVGSNNKYEEAIKKESLFRQVGTVFNADAKKIMAATINADWANILVSTKQQRQNFLAKLF